MLKNYLKIALRNIIRQKMYAFINVVGLALGMACAIVIMLFVLHELSYDRFHENADRIYRVVQEQRFSGTVQQVAVTGGPVGPALKDDYPEVEQVARLFITDRVVRYGDNQQSTEKIAYADSSVFEIFSFPLIIGDPVTALAQPNSIVLTQELAAKYFANDDPMGKTLTLDGKNYQVTGVVSSAPANSHFRFDAVASFVTFTHHLAWVNTSWGTNTFWTYVLLAPGASWRDLNKKLPDFVERHRGKEDVAHITYYLQPLVDIHLRSRMVAEIDANSDVGIVYSFAAIALFIILIACVNYTNLATARSTLRTLEVGVRKVLGAFRAQLLRQFLGESLLMSLLAMIIAVGLVEMSLPYLIRFFEIDLSFHWLDHKAIFAGAAILFLLVSLLAGTYPAIHLSSFRPLAVLKSEGALRSSGSRLRQALVVMQFTITIILLIFVGVAFRQMEFVRDRHLGFDENNLISIKVRDNSHSIALLKEELSQLPHVLQVTASSHEIGNYSQTTFIPEGAPPTEKEGRLMSYMLVDDDFISTLGMSLLAGRGFSREIASDSTAAYVINEAAVPHLGWNSADEALGKNLHFPSDDTDGRIIGVVRNCHFSSLHTAIEPLVLLYRPDEFDELTLRIRPQAIAEALSELEKSWHSLVPNYPFDYSFVDQRFARRYQSDVKVGKMFGVFAGLAVVIAGLGLFGLAAFIAERRTKEIGVRRVLGASAANIVKMLSNEFVRLVLLANLLAWPIAWLAANRWLNDFAYRVTIEWWLFVLAGILAVTIALMTVSTQALRAAAANPVDSLRYE